MTTDNDVYPRLHLVPVSLNEAKRFVSDHHRHNRPPISWKFGVGVADVEGTLVGVAMAGLPKARLLMDGLTLEVNRTCTVGTRNANSMLYGAIARATFALGYRRLVTYTLAEEPGTSLRAAGWTRDKEIPADAGWWRPGALNRGQPDLWGDMAAPTGPKVRWVKVATQNFPRDRQEYEAWVHCENTL